MTDQPIHLQPVPTGAEADDIIVFLGPVPPEEYEQRRRIRTARNAAAYKATQAESGHARTLCWMVTETATAWIYAPATTPELENVAHYLRRLLICADQAEQLGAQSDG